MTNELRQKLRAKLRQKKLQRQTKTASSIPDVNGLVKNLQSKSKVEQNLLLTKMKRLLDAPVTT